MDMASKMNKNLQAVQVKSFSLKQARRNSKTLVELTIGIIGLSGLLMAQLGQPNQTQAFIRMNRIEMNDPLVNRVIMPSLQTRIRDSRQRDRHLVTYLMNIHGDNDKVNIAVNNSCQSSWLGVFM